MMDCEMNELQCPVCFEIYNGNCNTPRLLSCGHCFCSRCLEQILPLRSCCPSCKNPISTHSVKSLPINYPLKNLAEKFQQKKSLGKTKQYSSLGTCTVHNNPQQLYCLNHKEFMCGMCSTLNHKDCKVTVIEESMSDIHSDYLTNIQLEVESIKQQDSLVEIKAATLKYRIYDKKEEVKQQETTLTLHGDERAKLGKALSDMIKLKDDMTNVKKLTSNNLKKLHTRFLNMKKGRSIEMNNSLQSGLTSKLTPRQIWNKAQNLHVCIERDAKKLYGPVTRDKKYLRVGCFKESEVLFKNSMKFEDFLYIITGSLNLPRKAFFQVELADCQQPGTIVIKTDHHSPRARNFLSLCLGISGYSYNGTKLYKVKDKGNEGERVCGGDYSFNDGSGSPAVVDGICGGDMQTVRYRRGQVRGLQPTYRESLSRFSIVLRDAKMDDGWPSVFATVESGLETMDNVAKRGGKKGKIKAASIYNCGVLLENPAFG